MKFIIATRNVEVISSGPPYNPISMRRANVKYATAFSHMSDFHIINEQKYINITRAPRSSGSRFFINGLFEWKPVEFQARHNALR